MFAMHFYEMIGVDSTVAVEILSLSIMMIVGFLMTRITKRLKLPNVTAYIVSGILIGPYCFDLIPSSIISGTAFLPDIALAFIAFSTGEYFRLETLKRNGVKVIWITLFESFFATILVFFLCFFALHLSLPFSVVLAALAAATAPASTMMTIRQTQAKGEFVDTLLQVVALDDIVGLMAYSVAVSIATALLATGGVKLNATLLPLLWNLLAIVLGGLFGAITALFMKTRHSSDNRLIITVTMLFFFCGLCALMGTSPLLGCMVMGTVYINITKDERLFRQLGYFTPPILMLFFVRSGVSFNLGALFSKSGSLGESPLIVVGIGYFVARIVGKYAGAFLGAKTVHAIPSVSRYLGLALIPQAGVAIGLSELGARALGGEPGIALQTIILASSVLYELIGPASAKAALYLSHSYSDEEESVMTEDGEISSPVPAGGSAGTTVDELIRQIEKIQRDLASEEESNLLDEKIFSEEADLYFGDIGAQEKVHKKKTKKDGKLRRMIKEKKEK